MMDHYVASQIGCAVELLDENVTRAEYADWIRCKATREKEPGKLDHYLCLILAKLSAFCGGSHDPSSYVYGRPRFIAKTVPAADVAKVLRAEFGG